MTHFVAIVFSNGFDPNTMHVVSYIGRDQCLAPLQKGRYEKNKNLKKDKHYEIGPKE